MVSTGSLMNGRSIKYRCAGGIERVARTADARSSGASARKSMAVKLGNCREPRLLSCSISEARMSGDRSSSVTTDSSVGSDLISPRSAAKRAFYQAQLLKVRADTPLLKGVIGPGVGSVFVALGTGVGAAGTE